MIQYADFTYLSQLLRCPLAHYYRYRLQLEPADGAKSIPMLAGSLGHALLQVHYQGADWREFLSTLYAESGIVAIGSFDYMTQGHWDVLLHNYTKAYPNDLELRVAALVEEPLLSERLRFGGIPDMIVEDSDGELAVWDHKFTTWWLASLEARLKLTNQLPLYCVLASEKLGKPVRRAVLNMIHMGPGASNPKSKAERFSRRPYVFSDWQLEEAERWVCMTRELDDYLSNKLEPPRNADIHCSSCLYQELCSARSQAVKDAVLATAFRKRSITGALLSGADMKEDD